MHLAEGRRRRVAKVEPLPMQRTVKPPKAVDHNGHPLRSGVPWRPSKALIARCNCALPGPPLLVLVDTVAAGLAGRGPKGSAPPGPARARRPVWHPPGQPSSAGRSRGAGVRKPARSVAVDGTAASGWPARWPAAPPRRPATGAGSAGRRPPSRPVLPPRVSAAPASVRGSNRTPIGRPVRGWTVPVEVLLVVSSRLLYGADRPV